MTIWKRLWCDERGAVVSAELVTVGTIAVLGATVGLNVAGSAINAELKEYASAIRSLDQSYAVRGHASCGASTAGSWYLQPDVEESIADLCAIDEDERRRDRRFDRPRHRPRLEPRRPRWRRDRRDRHRDDRMRPPRR